MKLLDTYFQILEHNAQNDAHHFVVSMLSTHPVYQGHFPGNPVSPGVCNMQMLKECAETVLGHDTDLVEVKQYRLTGIITPQKTPRLNIDMTLGTDQDTVQVIAKVYDDQASYIDFKGTLRKQQ
jgi:3-hydroxyacyl-[acyl-carrier-protein] dehydratase